MDIDLAALIVDGRSDDARELVRALAPEVVFLETDYTNSVHRAVQSHTDANYNICFLSESFPMPDVATFFNDIKKIGKDKTCIFIQVRADIEEDFDRTSLQEVGITTVISRKGTHADKQALEDAVKSTFYTTQVERKKLDVHGALRLLLKELDRNAADRKRGVARKMAAIPMDLVELYTSFDKDVLEDYFHTLEKQTSQAEPIPAEKIDIPEAILKKKLPGLEKDIYRGASSRVWGMLLDKHGAKDDTSAAPKSEAPPPTENKEPEEKPE